MVLWSGGPVCGRQQQQKKKKKKEKGVCVQQECAVDFLLNRPPCCRVSSQLSARWKQAIDRAGPGRAGPGRSVFKPTDPTLKTLCLCLIRSDSAELNSITAPSETASG